MGVPGLVLLRISCLHPMGFFSQQTQPGVWDSELGVLRGGRPCMSQDCGCALGGAWGWVEPCINRNDNPLHELYIILTLLLKQLRPGERS